VDWRRVGQRSDFQLRSVFSLKFRPAGLRALRLLDDLTHSVPRNLELQCEIGQMGAVAIQTDDGGVALAGHRACGAGKCSPLISIALPAEIWRPPLERAPLFGYAQERQAIFERFGQRDSRGSPRWHGASIIENQYSWARESVWECHCSGSRSPCE